MASRKSRRPKNPGMPKMPDGMENLSEEEMRGLQRMISGGRRPSVSSEEGTVSQKAHEDEVGRLRERIAELEGKLEKAKDEYGDLRDERDSFKARFESKLREIKRLEGELDDARGERNGLRSRVQKLDEELRRARDRLEEAPDASETEGLRESLVGKEAEIAALVSERDAALEELASARARMSGMESELEALRSEGTPGPDEPRAVAGKVVRSSATVFESELFTGYRYRVRISRDGRRMLFTPDVDGKVVCSGGRMEIPAMARMTEFRGRAEIDAFSPDGVTLAILL